VVSSAGGPEPADASRPAPHATAHRRCSAAVTRTGPRPAPQGRVCRIVSGGGNPDPSRDSARDTHAGGRDDQVVLPDSVDGGGWLGGSAGGGTAVGTVGCNNAVHDRNGRRDKTPSDKVGNGKLAGRKPFGRDGASASRGRTGQPVPVMAGCSHLCCGGPCGGRPIKKPRLLKQPGFSVSAFEARSYQNPPERKTPAAMILTKSLKPL